MSVVDKHIVSIYFYHNLIFIYKGHNDWPAIRDAIDRMRFCRLLIPREFA